MSGSAGTAGHRTKSPPGFDRDRTAGRTSHLFACALGSAALALGLFGGYWAATNPPSGLATRKALSRPAPSSPAQQQARRQAAATFLDAPAVVKFDGKSLATTWRQLGAIVDEQALSRPRTGRTVTLPLVIDRQKALETLVGYKDQHDRPPEDARLDLEGKRVIPEKPGFGIDVFASVGALERAAQTGKTDVELEAREIEPQVTRAKLGDIDVSQVMGRFETRFPVGERDRNHNLRVAAEKVNGHVIMPGEELSFNGVVGERTEKQGYRVAHVIQAGEMIDGLAGGACQISSTLHGAAFFAGLEIVSSRPHSRPSAYITMGMDATVAWPSTDLKLKNPYEFPVAIRYVVSQGTVRVEVLGKARPYDKIAFVREIKQELPYETVTREDDSMPIGAQVTEQLGFPGFTLLRKRVFYQGGKVVKEEKWNLRYPPTTAYLRIGTNPDPNLQPPEQPSLHGPMDPGGKRYSMEQ